MQLSDFLPTDATLLVALIGLATALITLIAALLPRRVVRRSEVVHETRIVECSDLEREIRGRQTAIRSTALALALCAIVAPVLSVAVPKERFDAPFFCSLFMSLVTMGLIANVLRRRTLQRVGTLHPRCHHCDALMSIEDDKCHACQAKNRYAASYTPVLLLTLVLVVSFLAYRSVLYELRSRLVGRTIPAPATSTPAPGK